MVSILNNLKIFLLEKRIKNQQTKFDFNSDFLPIKISHLETKKANKIELISLKMSEELLPYEINAGIKSDYLKKEFVQAREKLENKYYWKERALKQTLKRKNIVGSVELNNLSSEKAKELGKLNDKYIVNKPSKANIDIYEINKDIYEKTYYLKEKVINQLYDKKIASIKLRITARIKKHEIKLLKMKQQIKAIKKSKAVYTLADDVILKVENLSMYFGGLKAVDKLNFEVKEGEVFGLIGPNGAGKTTVFNCITRFYKPTDGEMYFRNKIGEIAHLNDIVVHNIIREGIARTFQNVEMIWELNVLENLLVAAHTMYRSGFFGHLFNSRLLRQEETVMRKKAEKILTDLELLEYEYSYPLGLPYGILKRIELARTLMINPKLIILDEPAAGLNESETSVLADTIRKIQKDYAATIFLVEHDMGLVMNICDTVCAISFGQKLAIGTPKEIQSSKIVQDAYLGGE